jgi:hypothetical protein
MISGIVLETMRSISKDIYVPILGAEPYRFSAASYLREAGDADLRRADVVLEAANAYRHSAGRPAKCTPGMDDSKPRPKVLRVGDRVRLGRVVTHIARGNRRRRQIS